ncbi:MAG: nicotinamidase [Acidobacteriota bacterium]
MPGSRSALLIVDVQNDFCPGGALPAPGGDRVVPSLNRYIAQAIESGMLVYASRDWHPPITSHFKAYGGLWPPHCVQGTAGADFHPSLKLPRGTIVVTKGEDPAREGYSSFDGRTADGQSLAVDLHEHQIETVYIGGLTTEYCVKQTALDAIREGFVVRVLADAIAGIEAHPGDSERALAEVSAAGAQVARGLPHARPTDVKTLRSRSRDRRTRRAG